MDLGTLIIGGLMLMVFIVPIVLANRSTKKSENKLVDSLTNLAKSCDTKITQFDRWNNTAIGISEDRNMLFFYRKTDDNEVNESIDLHTIQKCRVIVSSRTLKSNNEEYIVYDKLALGLIPYGNGKNEKILEFYFTDVSYQLDGERLLLENWNKIISGKLIQKKQSA